MESSIKNIQELWKEIKYLRLQFEKECYNKRINETNPRAIMQDDSFFLTIKKKCQNTINSDKNEKYKNKLDVLNKLIEKDFSSYVDGETSLYTLSKKVECAFVKDNFGLAKLEFCMNVVLDNEFDFECNKIAFPVISKAFGFDENYLINLSNEMNEAFSSICLDKSKNINNALLIGGILSIALIIPGIGGLIGGYAAAASTTTASLASVSCLGMAEGVAVLCIGAAISSGAAIGTSYLVLNKIDKEKFKTEFSKLSIDQTILSLVKTSLSLIYIRKFINDSRAFEIYSSIVEEYIDLKSDVDLRLFLKSEEIESDSKKNKIFANTDGYLKKKLFSL